MKNLHATAKKNQTCFLKYYFEEIEFNKDQSMHYMGCGHVNLAKY